MPDLPCAFCPQYPHNQKYRGPGISQKPPRTLKHYRNRPLFQNLRNRPLFQNLRNRPLFQNLRNRPLFQHPRNCPLFQFTDICLYSINLKTVIKNGGCFKSPELPAVSTSPESPAVSIFRYLSLFN